MPAMEADSSPDLSCLRRSPLTHRRQKLMALINRMARLFTADVHAVLDRLEEPDVLLKQAIREMEEELARSEQRVRILEQERTTLGERQRKTAGMLSDLEEQLDVCLANGSDELARKVIKRRLETERLASHLIERRAALDDEIAARSAAANEQREQLDVMRQNAELLTANRGGRDERCEMGFAVGDAEVEVVLLRERQKRQRS
jgi:phage shock protein A